MGQTGREHWDLLRSDEAGLPSRGYVRPGLGPADERRREAPLVSWRERKYRAALDLTDEDIGLYAPARTVSCLRLLLGDGFYRIADLEASS
jgi:hypothetical protein